MGTRTHQLRQLVEECRRQPLVCLEVGIVALVLLGLTLAVVDELVAVLLGGAALVLPILALCGGARLRGRRIAELAWSQGDRLPLAVVTAGLIWVGAMGTGWLLGPVVTFLLLASGIAAGWYVLARLDLDRLAEWWPHDEVLPGR